MNRKSILKKGVLIVSSCLLLFAIGFGIYVSDYYRAEEEATAILSQDNVTVNGHFTIITPEEKSESAIVFYPGGKVEHTAYLPLLNQISQQGITCILVEMPWNLAVFDIHRGNEILGTLPEIKHWYLMGHSLGGIMASVCAGGNDVVDGLILLGSYLYSDYPVAQTLTIHGSLEAGIAASIDYSENICVIPGGNHAQFGNYGPQKGDPDPETPREVQQAETVRYILEFMEYQGHI